ncbi:MAG: FAD-dependent oxidoreductase [Edaphobacter sp.]|nr:FAD-dependent oxidoreductase [Edaphobacter sp.]
MNRKTILISGAGIAGPTLAFWLSRYGFSPTIVERATGIRDGGYAVDFRGAPMNVLEKMGLVASIRAQETRTHAITIVDGDGQKLASMPDGFTSGDLEIMRGDLAHILYDATHGDTEYIFDDAISEIVQTDREVHVTFASGASRVFDLVVGADGLHSSVRSLVFGPESQFLHHLDYYIAIFTIPNYLKLDQSGLFYGEPGRKVGIFAAENNTEARASFYFSSPLLSFGRDDIEGQRQALRDTFQGTGWETSHLLQLMDEAPDFYFDSISQIRMDSWCKGRVALIGDAGYCSSPLSGMGTGMAVVGAYTLAGELKAAEGDYPIAFNRYEGTMRPFVSKCQKLVDGAEWFIPRSGFRLWLSNLMWRTLPYTPWKNMMLEMPLNAANSVEIRDYV